MQKKIGINIQFFRKIERTHRYLMSPELTPLVILAEGYGVLTVFPRLLGICHLVSVLDQVPSFGFQPLK